MYAESVSGIHEQKCLIDWNGVLKQSICYCLFKVVKGGASVPCLMDTVVQALEDDSPEFLRMGRQVNNEFTG